MSPIPLRKGLTLKDLLDNEIKSSERNLEISKKLGRKAMIQYWEVKLDGLLCRKDNIEKDEKIKGLEEKLKKK